MGAAALLANNEMRCGQGRVHPQAILCAVGGSLVQDRCAGLPTRSGSATALSPGTDQRLSGIRERCGSGEPRPDNCGMHRPGPGCIDLPHSPGMDRFDPVPICRADQVERGNRETLRA